MNRLLAGSVALLALAASGIVRAEPAAPVQSWSGWYAGVNAGYSWGQSDTSASFFNMFNNVTPGPILLTTHGTADMSGAIGGGQIGANWQSGNWLVGIEADFQVTGQKGSKSFTCPAANCNVPAIPANTDLTAATASHTQKLDWFATLRARLGIMATPEILAYVTGGPAWGRVKTTNVFTATGTAGTLVSSCPGPFCACPGPTCPYPVAPSNTKAGWTVGIGAEERLFGNWTCKFEYLYADLGRINTMGIFPTGNVSANAVPIQVNLSSKITDNILRVGLNYLY